MKTNYHTHTVFCDGSASARRMVETAVEKGFDAIGFSSHSDIVKDIGAYKAEIRSLAAEYAGRIAILCGIEAEYDTGFPRGDLDYVIGSTHYLRAPGGERFSFDHTPQILADGIRDLFGGDSAAFVRAYFAQEREMIERYDCDVIGHVDLVRKFNLKHPFFDETAAWYREELVKTADAVAASGKIVEVNTGAIARGWQIDAYPSVEMRALLRERGVKFILSSDAHAPETLDFAFDRFASAENYVTDPRRANRSQVQNIKTPKKGIKATR